MKKTDLHLKLIYLFFCLLFHSSISIGQVNLNLELHSPSYNGFNISCFGGRNGTIDLTILNGIPPYQMRWSNGLTSEDITGLSSGYYRVEVLDANGLSGNAEIMLTEPIPWTVELWKFTYSNEYNTSCFDCFDGIISTSPLGEVIPFSFLWNDGSTNQDRTNIMAGEYSVVVSDANGCTVRSSITLNSPKREVIIPDPPQLPCVGPSIVAWQQNPAFPDYIFSCWNRFGIGTDMPQERLDVKGFGKFAAYNTSSSFIRLGHDGIDPNGQNGNARIDNFGNGDLLINYGNPKNVKICAGNAGYVETGGSTFLATQNGKVGIGTKVPSDIFQINQGHNKIVFGSGAQDNGMLGYGIGYLGFNATRNVIVSNPNSNYFSMESDGVHNGGSLIYSSIAGGLNFVTFNSDINNSNGLHVLENSISARVSLGIQPTGEINIGYPQASNLSVFNSQLHVFASNKKFAITAQVDNVHDEYGFTAIVDDDLTKGFAVINTNLTSVNFPDGQDVFRVMGDGGVQAKSLKISQLIWSDFVFSNDYKLLDIDSLEKFIEINNHLPNVPSEETVCSNGVDVAEMQALLLQKIEELTLYIIQLKNDNIELKMRFNDSLK